MEKRGKIISKKFRDLKKGAIEMEMLVWWIIAIIILIIVLVFYFILSGRGEAILGRIRNLFMFGS